jgi:hypothetical protein
MRNSRPVMQARFTVGMLLGLAAWTAGGSVASAAYDQTQTNTYVGQSTGFYCGPATALMTLNSSTVNKNPLPTQLALYNSIQTIQGGLNQQGDYATSPDGLRGVLQAQDPAHNYVAYNIANYDMAIRTLAYNVDHYQIPGGALINRGAHWVDVFGVDCDKQPGLNNGFIVNGFYVRDPWTGFAGAGQGLGRYRYLSNTANGWQRYFTPQGYGNYNFGKWTGNYAFVTDPDADTEVISAEPLITGDTVDDVNEALSDALSDEALVPSLASAAAFENGAFSTSNAELVTLWNGGQDWVIPYYQTGSGDLSGVFMIDAATGALDQAVYEDVSGGDTGSWGSLNSLLAMEDSENAFNILNDNQLPEPASLSVLGLGAVGLILRRRRGA